METHQLKPAAIGSVRASSEGGGGARRCLPTRALQRGGGRGRLNVSATERRPVCPRPRAPPGPAAVRRRRTPPQAPRPPTLARAPPALQPARACARGLAGAPFRSRLPLPAARSTLSLGPRAAATELQKLLLTAADSQSRKTVLALAIKCLVPSGGGRKLRARAGHVDTPTPGGLWPLLPHASISVDGNWK